MRVIVDNISASQPSKTFNVRADVLHSASKYIDGQGRVLGGALVGNNDLMEKAFGVVRYRRGLFYHHLMRGCC